MKILLFFVLFTISYETSGFQCYENPPLLYIGTPDTGKGRKYDCPPGTDSCFYLKFQSTHVRWCAVDIYDRYITNITGGDPCKLVSCQYGVWNPATLCQNTTYKGETVNMDCDKIFTGALQPEANQGKTCQIRCCKGELCNDWNSVSTMKVSLGVFVVSLLLCLVRIR